MAVPPQLCWKGARGPRHANAALDQVWWSQRFGGMFLSIVLEEPGCVGSTILMVWKSVGRGAANAGRRGPPRRPTRVLPPRVRCQERDPPKSEANVPSPRPRRCLVTGNDSSFFTAVSFRRRVAHAEVSTVLE